MLPPPVWPLDRLAAQLLNFSDAVGASMDELPAWDGEGLKGLLKMSWRSLITRAIADSHEFFSSDFLCESERGSRHSALGFCGRGEID